MGRRTAPTSDRQWPAEKNSRTEEWAKGVNEGAVRGGEKDLHVS